MVTVQPAVVKTRRVRATLDGLLVPGAPQWERAAEAVVPLEPTPLDRQPSAYVQTAMQGQPRGAIPEVRVRALTAARAVFLRLEWDAPRPHRIISDVNVYADACGVLFPADGADSELGTMGSPDAPVVAWYWRAGAGMPFSVGATGLGTTEREQEHNLQAHGQWADGSWRVVFCWPLNEDGAPLTRGGSVPVAFAVWSGAARERAGLKSHSPVWHELQIG